MIRIFLCLMLAAMPALAQQRVGPLGVQNNLGEIAAGGSSAQAAARANLGAARAADVANVLDSYGGAVGAKCDGSTDDTASIQAALTTAKSAVVIPAGSNAVCIVSATLTPRSGQTITGLNGKPTIKLVSGSVGRLFDLTGLHNVEITGLNLDGTSAAAGADFIRFLNTTYSKLTNTTVLNPPGSTNGCILLAQASADNEISGNTITGCASTAIIGNNAGVVRNKIHHNTISGALGFGIRLMTGASRNEVSYNIIPQSGVEPLAVSLTAHHNRLIGNHVEGSGDNGISIVGDHNTISGNEVINNGKAGIYLWGSSNTVTDNNLLNNNLLVAGWNCIGIGTNYGGAAQHNVVKGNTCDDDQAVPTQLGIGINTALVASWTTSTAYTSGVSYVAYGLNLYLASTTGTSGATPPTCTSGTCSDGTVTWTYQSSYLSQAGALFNDVWDNHVIRWAGTAPFVGTLAPSKALNRNPDFLISQTQLDAASSTTVSFGQLVIDGWRTNTTNSNQFVYQRTSGISLPGYQYALTATAQTNFSNLTTSNFQLVDRIDGISIGQLNWGSAAGLPLTLDACLNTSGITGKIAYTIDNGTAGGTLYTYVGAFNVTAAGAWQCFSQTIPAPPSGSTWNTSAMSIGAKFDWTLGAGSTLLTSTYGWQTGAFSGPTDMAQPVTVSGSVVRLAAVHLYQAGTQYIPRSFTEELAIAQRWFYSTFLANTAPHTNAGMSGAACTTNSTAGGKPSVLIATPVKMYGVAASEVVTTYNPSASNALFRDWTASADVAVSVDPAASNGPNGVFIVAGATVAAAGDVLCIHATLDSGL